MGKLIGKVTDTLGLTDNEGEENAAKNASNASAQSYALSKEAIAFQKEQYADWKAVYGDIQENLGDYFKKLTPEKITALGLQNQEMEYKRAKTLIEEDFAQRGLNNSGMEMAVKSNLTFSNAEARAKIRTGADEEVANQKLGFLGVGLGQGTQMLGLINSASNTGVAAATNLAGAYLGQQTQLSGNNTSAMNDLVGTGFGFLKGGK